MAGTGRLYISVDLEGVAGIVHWDQIMATGRSFAEGQRLVLGELNAVCRAAREAGFDDVVVNDSHAQMRNLDPQLLVDGVRVISGHFKPLYMMEGIDASFDAAVFLGYHAPAGWASILSHTYSPQIIWEAQINEEVTGETGLNALVAHYYGVPVILISGDEQTVSDAGRWIPESVGVIVKWSRSRFAAESMSVKDAQALLFTSTKQALTEVPSPPADGPTTIDLTFLAEDMASVAEWAGGVKRTGRRSVRIERGDGLSAFRAFVTVLFLARNVVDS